MDPIIKEITTSDMHNMYCRLWNNVDAKNNTNIILIIVHGMAEHSQRYDEFANFLNENGITVYAPDLRGHGLTGKGEERGWYAEQNGWMRTALDVIELTHDIKSEQPLSKIVLFGHSMGSYLSRQIISSFPNEFDAVVISGTGTPNALIKVFGKLITDIEKKENRP